MWVTWKERNTHTFIDVKVSVTELKSLIVDVEFIDSTTFRL